MLYITYSWRMVLAVDIMYGRGSSNEMCPQLQPKKTKVRLYLLLVKQLREFTNKTEHSSFQSGCVIRVVKHLKRRLVRSAAVAIATLYRC